MFLLSLLPPGDVSDWFAFKFLFNLPNDKRVEQFCFYLPDNYVNADSIYSSASVVRMICLITEDHKRTWAIPCPFQCPISQWEIRMLLFLYLHWIFQNEAYIKMRSVTTRRLKKPHSRKRIYSPQKLEYRSNLNSRIEFVSSVSFTFLTNNSLMLSFTKPLATSVTVHIVAQNNRHYACQTTVI